MDQSKKETGPLPSGGFHSGQGTPRMHVGKALLHVLLKQLTND